ncbi:MAG: HD domain-containing phosphohydrolase [Xanthobacteraceae bacterium]
MNRIAVISDSAGRANDLKVRLAGFFEAEFFHLDGLPDAAPGEFTFVDINLRDPARVSSLKRWLKRRPANAQVIFGVIRESHLESIQAYAIGATGLFPRPVDGRLLSWKLSGGISSIARNSGESENGSCESISASVNALQNVFAAAISGDAPDMQLLSAAGSEVIAKIEEEGLAHWLDVVRNHHSQTYQHCLIVTAVAVSFGRQLGFSNADKERLASAGLLHDIGKARIPIEILEKPGPLSKSEWAVMRTHPELGFDALREAPGLQPEMVDMVVHHHEYLDGSGYPHGLQASEIPDLVRTITIADVYGALIERRSYRPPLSAADAYQILQDMVPKLDKDLVREFRPIAQSVI